jgi:hypothetical protein
LARRHLLRIAVAADMHVMSRLGAQQMIVDRGDLDRLPGVCDDQVDSLASSTRSPITMAMLPSAEGCQPPSANEGGW